MVNGVKKKLAVPYADTTSPSFGNGMIRQPAESRLLPETNEKAYSCWWTPDQVRRKRLGESLLIGKSCCAEKNGDFQPRVLLSPPCARKILTRFLPTSDQLLIPHPYTTLQSDLHIACLTRLYARYRTPFILRGLCLFKARPLGLQSVSATAWSGVPGGAPCISVVNTPAGCRCQRGLRPRSRGRARKGLPGGRPHRHNTACSRDKWCAIS